MGVLNWSVSTMARTTTVKYADAIITPSGPGRILTVGIGLTGGTGTKPNVAE